MDACTLQAWCPASAYSAGHAVPNRPAIPDHTIVSRIAARFDVIRTPDASPGLNAFRAVVPPLAWRVRIKQLTHGLNRLKRRSVSRDTLLKKVAVRQQEAGRVAKFVKIREPMAHEPVNRKTIVCTLDRAAWKKALDRDGCYILRGYLPWKDVPSDLEKQAAILWEWYMQLVQIEESFKTLKSDLDLRPIHHQIERHVETHILVAFLAYGLTMTLRMKHKRLAPGLTPREVLKSLGGIQMVDVHFPATDGRTLIMPRYTEPECEHRMILEKLNLQLPTQPPPRIQSGEVDMPRHEST